MSLPSLPSESRGHLRIRLVKFFLDKGRDDGRYWIESLDKKPFKVNGVYTERAWLMRGQILDFSHNRMIFSANPSSRRTTLLEDIPEKVVTGRMSILLEGETGTGKSHLGEIDSRRFGSDGELCPSQFGGVFPFLDRIGAFRARQGRFYGGGEGAEGGF